MTMATGDKAAEDQSKELQRLYIQMQILQQQSQQLQKQMQAIDAQLEELEGITDGLAKLKDVKPGTELFVPFAGGIFLKAELKDNADVLLNVGAGVAVAKPVPDTIATVSEQIAELGRMKEQVSMQLERVIAKAREIEKQMEKLV